MTYTIAAVVVVLLAGSIYAVWKAHEESKAGARDRERSVELERVMHLTHDLGKRGPTGFQRRVS